MISLSGLLTLLGIPIRAFDFGSEIFYCWLPHRKYSNSLKHCLRLLVFRTAVSLSVFDAYYISFMSNNFVINKIVPLFISPLPVNYLGMVLDTIRTLFG